MPDNKPENTWWRDLVESSRLEMKAGKASPDAIGRSVCGFANAEGGSILIGMNEQGEVLGVSEPERLISLLRKNLAEGLSPRLAVSVTPIQVQGKDLVIVDVPQGADRPYTWSRRIFIRRQEKTVEAGPEIIGTLLVSPKAFHWERQPALGIEVSDLDEQEIRKSFDEARRNHLLNLEERFDPLNTLRLFHLADGGQIANGAVVLFGNKPENRFPQSRVRAVCYRDVDGDELLDSRIIEGNAFHLLERIMEFLHRHTSISSSIPTGELQRDEKAAYPFLALREAVLNAIQHRDYEAFDGGISVVVRPHGIEIWNSGALPSGMTIDDLKRGHHSRPHNPDIAHVFFLRGFVERIGSGAERMIRMCRRAGLPDPEWSQDSGGIMVVLRKAAGAAALNERQTTLLRSMKPEEAISSADVRERFSISDRQARNDLTDLVKTGFLRRVGSGPATRYVRTNKDAG
jgi:ATP-dependent DNA helicase RecG